MRSRILRLGFVALVFVGLSTFATRADPTCIDISGTDWKASVDGKFGQRICLRGKLYASADGVYFSVKPAFGNPPYGSVIRVNLPARPFFALNVRPGDLVELDGVLLGKGFCRREPTIIGCSDSNATWFEYFFYVASDSGIRPVPK